MKKRRTQTYGLLTLALWGSLISLSFVWPVWAAPPSITSVNFPSNLETQATASGQIDYQDPDRDVLYARFDVVDGRYYRVRVSAPTMTSREGHMYFTLSCTPYPQQITLALTLFDAAGERSQHAELTFTCGQPPIYDFDIQQALPLPVSQKIPLNIFILDDGETALAEGAIFPSGILGEPLPEVVQVVERNVLPKLTGIWDQCGLGFEVVNVSVVKPEQVPVSGGNLKDRLFERESSGLVIRHGQTVGNLLHQATFTLWTAAQEQRPAAAQAFNVLVVGARILTLWEGRLTDIEGFSESGWPNYAIVRWGAILEDVVSKQMISTLAHELGHNLGLPHPEEDRTSEASEDPMNLMNGSGVSPQPRAHILAGQCRTTEQVLAQLRAGMPGVTGSLANPPITRSAEASVRWLGLCVDNACTGKVSLSVAAQGFADLQSFSFALFEYSRDGEHFVEIGVDRSYQDGFNALWDTTPLPNGRYVLRATVTDARGVRASVLAEVTVRN